MPRPIKRAAREVHRPSNLRQQGQAAEAAIAQPGEIRNLLLPFPPSLNHQWRIGARGTVYTVAQVKAYRQRVAQACLVQLVGRSRPLAGPYGLFILAHPVEGRQRPDADNLCKVPVDALMYAGVLLEDSLIEELTVRYGRIYHGRNEQPATLLVHVWTLDDTMRARTCVRL